MQMPFLIALAFTSCVFGVELFGIFSLLKKISSYKKEQKQKEKMFFSFLPGLFLPGGMTGGNLFFSILIILALAGAMVWICLAEYWRILNEPMEKNAEEQSKQEEKQQIFQLFNQTFGEKEEPKAFASWQEDTQLVGEIRAEEEQNLIETEDFAAEGATQSAEPSALNSTESNQPSVTSKPQKHIPPIPLSVDEEDDDTDTDEEDDPADQSGEVETEWDPVDDPNVFLGDEKIIGFNEKTGCNIVAHYRKSFEAKLIQSKRNIKHYYSELKNELLSYEGNKSRISWTADSFHNGRNAVAKINVKTRVLELYLALDPASLEGSVYRGKDVSKLKKYADTPFQYKIKTPRKFNWAMELIEKTCENLNLVKAMRIPEDFEEKYAFDHLESLVKRGLIKEYIREEPVENVNAPTLVEEENESKENPHIQPAEENLRNEVQEQPSVPAMSEREEPIQPPEKEEKVPETEAYTPIPNITANAAYAERIQIKSSAYEQKSLNWDLIPSVQELKELKERNQQKLFEKEELQNFRTRFEEELSTSAKQPEFIPAVEKEEKFDFAAVVETTEEKSPVLQEVSEKEKESHLPNAIRTLAVTPEESEREQMPNKKAAELRESESIKEPIKEKAEELRNSEAPGPQIRMSDPGIAMADIKDLEESFERGAVINLRSLKAKGLLPQTAVQLKIYTTGSIAKAFTVEANKFTMEAILAIHSAGGETVVVLS